MTAHTARTEDGALLAWRQRGAGEPLLLISGQAVDSSSWDPIVPDLARGFRVITFDQRGTGHSEEGTEERYTTRALAGDVLAVLDAAGVGRAHVYGHSMGGRVAQWLAIDHPDRLGALVLGATTGGDRRGVARSDRATADLASGDPERLAPLFFADGTRRAGAEAFFDQQATPRAKALHRRASRRHDAWDELVTITAPTLVIHGVDDAMTPVGNATRLAELIPGAELALRPGMRHGYYLEDPSSTMLVSDFLRRHPLDP